MNILIAGIDGYLGWALAQSLAMRGHRIGGLDSFLRRTLVGEMQSHSVVPIADIDSRIRAFDREYGGRLYFKEGDLQDYQFTRQCLAEFEPDTIVHLGEIPSAPYSMIDREHCVSTMSNNVLGTLNLIYAVKDICPDVHLVKLGTMGEYGTPNVDIPEGFFDLQYRGRSDRVPFPRQAGSWYHWTKVHDSNNIMFACNIWGLRSTDVMQGVVYGTRLTDTDLHPDLSTRFDIDPAFGTAVNRFCAMAIIGHPLTLYGRATQKRSFIPLRDSMQCLTLAIENPADAGEYRVFNQFDEVYDIRQLAEAVRDVAAESGLDVILRHFENPRIESEQHHYRPDHHRLHELGYRPTQDLRSELRVIIDDLIAHEARIAQVRDILVPDINWRGYREMSSAL